MKMQPLNKINTIDFFPLHVRHHAQGIFISRVAEDGPSAVAGLRAGDRLLSVCEQLIV